MKRHIVLVVLMTLALSTGAVAGNNQVIVRDTGGLTALQNSCQTVGCTVNYGLDGKQGQLFLVTPTQTTCSGLIGCLLDTTFNLLDFIANLLLQPRSEEHTSELQS